MEEVLAQPIFDRSLPLLGQAAISRLIKSKVAIFGLGGVGSYAAEALARSGIGHFDLIDPDVVDPTNLNRQLCASNSTVGELKVTVVANRIKDINPKAICQEHPVRYQAEQGLDFLPNKPDFIVDAIDDLKAKIDLIIQANNQGIPIISALGAGNKFDPTAFEIVDIYETYNDPLAKRIRGELRKAGIKNQPVVFSPEKPAIKNTSTIPSLPFVPSVSGLICASYVVKEISKKQNEIS